LPGAIADFGEADQHRLGHVDDKHRPGQAGTL